MEQDAGLESPEDLVYLLGVREVGITRVLAVLPTPRQLHSAKLVA